MPCGHGTRRAHELCATSTVASRRRSSSNVDAAFSGPVRPASRSEARTVASSALPFSRRRRRRSATRTAERASHCNWIASSSATVGSAGGAGASSSASSSSSDGISSSASSSPAFRANSRLSGGLVLGVVSLFLFIAFPNVQHTPLDRSQRRHLRDLVVTERVLEARS